MRAPAVDRCVVACLVLVCETALAPAVVLESGGSVAVDRGAARQVSKALAGSAPERPSPLVVTYLLARGPKRALTQTELHDYEVWLRKGEAVEAAFAQEDLDIGIEISLPRAGAQFRVDRLGSPSGREDVVIVAESSGLYRMRVACPGLHSPEGRYQVVSVRRHPARPKDRSWMKAARVYSAALVAIRATGPDHLKQAESGFRAAERFWKEAGYLPGMADSMYWIASVWNLNGVMGRTVSSFEEASRLYARAKNQKQQAQALAYAGSTLEMSSEFERAIPYFRRALELVRAELERLSHSASPKRSCVESARKLLLRALVGKGLSEVLSEDFLSGQEALGEALQLARELRSRHDEGLALAGQGIAFFLQGDSETATRLESDAKAIFEESPKEVRELLWMDSSLAESYRKAGVPERAVEIARSLLPRIRSLEDRHSEPAILNNLSLALFSLHRDEEALEAASQAQKVSAELGDAKSEAASWAHMGSFQARLGREGDAEASFHRVFVLLEGREDLRIEMEARFGLAVLARGRGDLATAQRTVEKVLLIIDRLSRKAVNARERSTLLSMLRDPFDFWIEVLMQRDALQPGAGWASLGFSASDTALGRGVREAVEGYLRKGGLAASAHQAMSDGHRLRFFDGETVLLEYYLTEREGFLWIATRKELRSARVSGLSVLRPLITELYAALSQGDQPGRPDRARELASQLGHLLLAPAEEELKERRRLVVALPAALELVPFSLLPAPRASTEPLKAGLWPEALSTSHEVIEAPSLATIEAVRRRRVSKVPDARLLALIYDPVTDENDARFNDAELNVRADSAKESGVSRLFQRLPFSESEAKAILDLAGVDRVFQAGSFAARREILTSRRLGAYRILHFSTHGVFRGNDPQGASLVLSLFDRKRRPIMGFVSAQDIEQLRLRCDLVVLSACSSGQGPQVWGEGLAGLSQAFFKAGAKRVIVSLWGVNDEATAALMSRFYENLLKRHLQPSAALQQAQETMRQNPRWSSPYYWAGFVLKGDWR